MSANSPKRTTDEKIALFASCFSGRSDVYGTYDPATGKARQVKAAVTRNVILSHLKGARPLGVYPLVRDRIRFLAVDFDDDNPMTPIQFVTAARHYGLACYIERSKSKGYHVWLFFDDGPGGRFGVSAARGRLVARWLLEQTERPHTEIFPKQDKLDTQTLYGNFINAPLFGALVPRGRTVFVDEMDSLKPYSNQWDFLAGVKRAPESLLDEIIELNEIGASGNMLSGASKATSIGASMSKVVVAGGGASDLVRSSPAQSHGSSVGAGGASPHMPRAPKSSRESSPPAPHSSPYSPKATAVLPTFGLPMCAQRMLTEGVRANQRVAAFRLAVQLRKAGISFDIAVAALRAWALKNQPDKGRGVITDKEIVAQAKSAYTKQYRGCGCDDPTVNQFCAPECPMNAKR